MVILSICRLPVTVPAIVKRSAQQHKFVGATFITKLRPQAGPKKWNTLTERYGGPKATRKTKTGRKLFDKEEFEPQYHVRCSGSIHRAAE